MQPIIVNPQALAQPTAQTHFDQLCDRLSQPDCFNRYQLATTPEGELALSERAPPATGYVRWALNGLTRLVMGTAPITDAANTALANTLSGVLTAQKAHVLGRALYKEDGMEYLDRMGRNLRGLGETRAPNTASPAVQGAFAGVNAAFREIRTDYSARLAGLRGPRAEAAPAAGQPAQAQSLQQRVTVLEGEKRQLNTEKTALQGRITGLERDKTTLQQDKVELQRDKRQLILDKDRFVNKNRTLSTQNAELTQQLGGLTSWTAKTKSVAWTLFVAVAAAYATTYMADPLTAVALTVGTTYAVDAAVSRYYHSARGEALRGAMTQALNRCTSQVNTVAKAAWTLAKVGCGVTTVVGLHNVLEGHVTAQTFADYGFRTLSIIRQGSLQQATPGLVLGLLAGTVTLLTTVYAVRALASVCCCSRARPAPAPAPQAQPAVQEVGEENEEAQLARAIALSQALQQQQPAPVSVPTQPTAAQQTSQPQQQTAPSTAPAPQAQPAAPATVQPQQQTATAPAVPVAPAQQTPPNLLAQLRTQQGADLVSRVLLDQGLRPAVTNATL